MIIDFNRYNGGGGSGSGVTPQEVQRQIDSALTYYWESAITESAITEAVSGLATEQYVQDALSGVNLDNYWTSAQTEDAISAATSGKADAANLTENRNEMWFPIWSSQGVVQGGIGNRMYMKSFFVNGDQKIIIGNNNQDIRIYAPTTSGNPGEILVSTGSGAPVWSAVTGGGGDMSNYWNSAQTKSYVDSAATNLQDQIDTMDDVVAAALVDLNDRVYEISGSTPDISNYWTSAQTANAISNATQDKVISTDVRLIVKLTQSDYDQLVLDDDVDPDTFYIIVNSI